MMSYCPKYRSVYDYPTTEALHEALLQPEDSLNGNAITSIDHHRRMALLGPPAAGDQEQGQEAAPSNNNIREEQQQAIGCSLSTSSSIDGHDPIRHNSNKSRRTYDWYVDNTDPTTQRAQSVDYEVQRLLDLKSYMILDTVTMDVRAREGKHDFLAGMAARFFDNKYFATTTLVDLGRQYFLSYTFSPVERTIPRKLGFCSHTILHQGDVLVVPDTDKDERFCHNPYVTGQYRVRFYASAPLISKNGYRLGAFSLTGTEPRPEGLTRQEKDVLIDFARLAMDAIEDHRRLSIQRMQLRHASQVLASAANDLMTPLMGIQLSTTLLAEDAEFTRKLQESEKAGIRIATSCVDSIVGICRKLRTLKKTLRSSMEVDNDNQPQQGMHLQNHFMMILDDPAASADKQSTAASTSFSISNTVERLDNVMNAVQKRVPLYVNLDPSVPSMVTGIDEVAMFRALLNLLQVSLQRTRTGFVRLAIRAAPTPPQQELTLMLQPQPQPQQQLKLVFECEDTGSPPPDSRITDTVVGLVDADWILAAVASTSTDKSDNNYDANATTAEQERSSFINLLDLVESLGSALHVSWKNTHCTQETSSSSYPKISTTSFVFAVPIIVPSISDKPSEFDEKSESATLKRKPRERLSSSSSHNNNLMTISSIGQRRGSALIVDDCPILRKVLGRALATLGMDATLACDGMEGLELMQKHGYDFVLLDFLMPVMDGLETIRRLREWEAEHRPSLRQYVVGISAHASGDDADIGMKRGMDGFKSKPLILEDLSAIAQCEEVLALGGALDDEFERQHKTWSATKEDDNVADDPKPQETCLIATQNRRVEQDLVQGAQENAWIPVTATSKREFGKKLRSRNWDAVIFDGDSPEVAVAMQEFRDWEMHHRVRRQRCVYLLSSGFERRAGISHIDLPPGVDGVLGKPTTASELERLLRTAQSQCSASFFSVGDIVIR